MHFLLYSFLDKNNEETSESFDSNRKIKVDLDEMVLSPREDNTALIFDAFNTHNNIRKNHIKLYPINDKPVETTRPTDIFNRNEISAFKNITRDYTALAKVTKISPFHVEGSNGKFESFACGDNVSESSVTLIDLPTPSKNDVSTKEHTVFLAPVDKTVFAESAIFNNSTSSERKNNCHKDWNNNTTEQNQKILNSLQAIKKKRLSLSQSPPPSKNHQEQRVVDLSIK